MAHTKNMVRRSRAEFLRVLDECSAPPYEIGQLNLFSDEVESFIKKQVDRMLYEPCLPNAGDNERHMIKRLEKMAADTSWDGHARAYAMAAAFKALLPEDPRHAGQYYVRHALTPKTDRDGFKWAKALVDAARAAKQWDRKWFAEQLLLGFPEGVSNFQMECLFLLRNSEGLVTRLVRLKNIKGEVSRGPNPGGSEILDSDSFASSERFSRWCLSRGNFVWDSGVTELRMLQLDLSTDAAWRVVTLVESVGWHPIANTKHQTPNQTPNAKHQNTQIPKDSNTQHLLPGIWFFDECAYVERDGKMERIMPDGDNIIWHNGEGYFLNRKGRESQFLQGRPPMKPEETAKSLLSGVHSPESGVESGWVNKPVDKSEEALLRAYFREVCVRLQETLGGLEANLGLGTMFSYAVAPELFKQLGFFPGLFVHGIKGSGKTKFTSWLMSVWGYMMQSGISLSEKTSTAVGMLQEAENYSNQPLWFDEFREHQIDAGKVSIMRNAFDRSSQAKWSPDGKQRDIRTVFIISGESTTTDSATRQRYPHIQVSAHKRKVNHLEWFTNNRENFFLFGRVLMERRPEFAQLFFMFLKNWMENPAMKDMDQRDKAVHGIGYAAWLAMSGLLESHTAQETGEFKAFMLTHARSAATDVASDTNINIFFSDMVTAVEAGELPLDVFHLESTMLAAQPGAPEGQGRWIDHELYVDPEPAMRYLSMFLSKSHEKVTLKRKDLRDQLSKENYWIAGPHDKRFGENKGTKKAWGIKVDLHPMGGRVISNEEHQHYLTHVDEGDPRMGELFSIIDRIVGQRQAEERAKA